ncbi:zinc-binding protein [Musa troglodytarum]|uniref:Zinc-binding protein n=1 Tax=Musa troglodytarum TaxID=320322 RepID=A0A9E7FNS0_9LILI|nr:zinc-binding protein [Musa troglodytarum]
MGRGAYGGGNGVAAPAAAMPGWLGGLVEETFFVGCGAHESRKKNEKNIFCLDCCTSICPHCAAAHPSHPLLQVRRYVYNDVVRLDDLEKLIDCSYVQPYTINSAKVVFLKPRPQSRPFKGSGNICLTCDRILQEPFHFCSLSCKVRTLPLSPSEVSSIDDACFSCCCHGSACRWTMCCCEEMIYRAYYSGSASRTSPSLTSRICGWTAPISSKTMMT